MSNFRWLVVLLFINTISLAALPANVTFYASFDSSLNADYSVGSGSATTVVGYSLPTLSSDSRGYFGYAADFGLKSENRAISYAVAGNMNLNRGSLEFWWKPYVGFELAEGEQLFYVGADSSHCMYFEKAWGTGNGGYMRLRYRNGTNDRIFGDYVTSYDSNRWQHYVVNWDNLTSKLEVFINGYMALSDTGFTPLTAEQAGSFFQLAKTSGCMLDEVIIRNEPMVLSNPYSTPLTALKATATEINQATAEDADKKIPPSVQQVRQKRFGIIMDLTGMIYDGMYHDEATFKNYIDQMATYGVTDLALRAHGMGAFTYPTQIEQIEPTTTDFGQMINQFDHLEALVRYGHEANIRVHLWFPMFDEGAYPPASLGGDPSFEVGSWIQTFVDSNSPWSHYTIFARNNPDKLWKHKDGRLHAMCLSYAYPEVRQYRIAQLQEAIDYGVDGIILDMTRWGWQNDRYLSGIYDSKGYTLMGHEQPIVDAWAADSNNPNISVVDNADTDWVKFRADMSMTQFLRDLKVVTSSQNIELGVNVFTDRNLERNHLDIQTWISEELVDVIYPYHLDFSPAICLPWKWYEITNEFVQYANGTSVKIIPCQMASWLDQGALSIPIFSSVFNAGAYGTLLYEAESTHSGHYQAIESLKRMDLFGETADLNADGKVDFADFCLFAQQWLENGCKNPYWCNGADLSKELLGELANNCLIGGTFLHHIDSLNEWDINTVLHDYSTGLGTIKTTDWFGNTIVLPNHGNGFIGNGATTNGLGSYSPHIEFNVATGDNVPETDFTIGCWVQLANSANKQIISVQGPRTNERAEIDYGNMHPNYLRFQINDGQSGYFSKEMNMPISSPTWLYVALSFKVAGIGESGDTFEFYVFNDQGQRIQNSINVLSQPTSPIEPLDWRNLRIGGWHPAVNLSPVAVDEVSVQHYLLLDQISKQVAEMVQQRALRADCNYEVPLGKVDWDDLEVFTQEW